MGRMSETDDVVLAEMRECCRTARSLVASGTAPTREYGRLVRRHGFLQQGYPEVGIDWSAFIPSLTRVPGFWKRMRTAAERLRSDELVEGAVGFMRRAEERAPVLWAQVVGPLVHVYGLRHPDWRWNKRAAETVIKSWRRVFGWQDACYLTLAPVDNLVSRERLLRLGDRLAIRRLTDDDRQRLWRSFGAPQNPSTIAPTIEDLERWKVAVEYRWEMPPMRGVTQEVIEPVVRVIEQLVCALRLQQPAVVGTKIFWTWIDPPELVVLRPGQELLFARDPSVRFEDRQAAVVGPSDVKSLKNTMRALESASDKRLRLALRRFDSAYQRKESEDALIDLWVAFEALLVPDGTQELSYRAALRIARLAGRDQYVRRLYFRHAKESYKVRSKIVHGEHVPVQTLRQSLDHTRELAREVLRTWLLNPPSGGVTEIDDALLH